MKLLWISVLLFYSFASLDINDDAVYSAICAPQIFMFISVAVPVSINFIYHATILILFCIISDFINLFILYVCFYLFLVLYLCILFLMLLIISSWKKELTFVALLVFLDFSMVDEKTCIQGIIYLV